MQMITIGWSVQFPLPFPPAWRRPLGKGVDRRPSSPYEFAHSLVHLARFPCGDRTELPLKTVYYHFLWYWPSSLGYKQPPFLTWLEQALSSQQRVDVHGDSHRQTGIHLWTDDWLHGIVHAPLLVTLTFVAYPSSCDPIPPYQSAISKLRFLDPLFYNQMFDYTCYGTGSGPSSVYWNTSGTSKYCRNTDPTHEAFVIYRPYPFSALPPSFLVFQKND